MILTSLHERRAKRDNLVAFESHVGNSIGKGYAILRNVHHQTYDPTDLSSVTHVELLSVGVLGGTCSVTAFEADTACVDAELGANEGRCGQFERVSSLGRWCLVNDTGSEGLLPGR